MVLEVTVGDIWGVEATVYGMLHSCYSYDKQNKRDNV